MVTEVVNFNTTDLPLIKEDEEKFLTLTQHGRLPIGNAPRPL